VRLFVAAELPPSVVGALVAWRPALDGVRPVAAESLHLTLAFLGERTQEEAMAAAGVVRSVAAPVDGLVLGSGRWLPPRRPRVLAVEVGDPSGGLAAVQAAVVRGLGEAIGFRDERRAFFAHVTVARVRSGARVPDGALPGLAERDPFALAALTLMRSRLNRSPPAPARYEPVERVALSPFRR
jgi:2'-5' RNA ligase